MHTKKKKAHTHTHTHTHTHRHVLRWIRDVPPVMDPQHLQLDALVVAYFLHMLNRIYTAPKYDHEKGCFGWLGGGKRRFFRQVHTRK